MFFLQMSGFPGSGKSTLAKLIAENTGAIILDHDIVKSSLLESVKDNIDIKLIAKASYDIEWSLIDSLLSQGFSVIHDSPCFFTEGLEKGMGLAKKNNVKYKYVECYLNNIKEINDRLTNRERMISQIEQVLADDAAKEFFKRWIDSSKRPSDNNYLIVDSGKPTDSYINKVIKYISE